MAVKSMTEDTNILIICNEVGKVYDGEAKALVPLVEPEKYLSGDALVLFNQCWGMDRGARESIVEVDGKAAMSIEEMFTSDFCDAILYERLHIESESFDEVEEKWMPVMEEALRTAAERLSGEVWADGCDFYISECTDVDTNELFGYELTVIVPAELKDRYLEVLAQVTERAVDMVSDIFVEAAAKK